MALIACPECNKQVSDMALTCPDCGYPLEQKDTPKKEKKRNPIMVWLIILLIVVVPILYLVYDDYSARSQNTGHIELVLRAEQITPPHTIQEVADTLQKRLKALESPYRDVITTDANNITVKLYAKYTRPTLWKQFTGQKHIAGGDPQYLIKFLPRTGHLEFKKKDPNDQNAWLETGIDGSAIKESHASKRGPSDYIIEIELTPQGKEQFATLTQDLVGEPLGIFFDGKLISAPIVRSAITGGKAMIEGSFSPEEAKGNAVLMQYPLPVQLTLIKTGIR